MHTGRIYTKKGKYHLMLPLDSNMCLLNKFNCISTSYKGFTLVEVIVVAVIVAILSITAGMMYRGYVEEARLNTANNTAAAAATFLHTAINMGENVGDYPNLNGNGQWTINLSSGSQSIFKCPKKVILTLDHTNYTVKAIYNGIESETYKYNEQ